MIRVDGIQIRRVLIPELADRLIHAGENTLASKLLTASAVQQDVTLTEAERVALLAAVESGSTGELTDLATAFAQGAHNVP